MKLTRFNREKGQGLTEYVLIIAFIAGIAIAMFGGNGSLKGTVVGTFTETVRILAGLFDEKTDWGHMDVGKFNSDNQEDRLIADQKALENIAKFFLTKTKGEIKNMLNINNNNGSLLSTGKTAEDVVTLGWLEKNDQGGTEFVLQNTETNGNNVKTIYSNLNASDAQYIFNWAQGDYSQNSIYSDDTNKFFVSDYPLKNGWTNESYERGNGVRLRVQYGDIPEGGTDNDRPVIAAKIAIDPGSQKKEKYGLKNASSGLEVGTKKNADGTVTVKTNINDNLSNNFNF